MPLWLCNQLMQAYQKKNRKQVRLLNECWFFYRSRCLDEAEARGMRE